MSPAKYDIRLLRVAEDDLTEIILYVASDRPNAATKLADRFDQKLVLLADNPFLGAMPTEVTLAHLGYRYLVLDNYLIFYVVEAQTIYIHRIVHGARDYTPLL
jgi:plasmid stabilization system protein ParE